MIKLINVKQMLHLLYDIHVIHYALFLPSSGWYSSTSVYMRLFIVTLNTTHQLAM